MSYRSLLIGTLQGTVDILAYRVDSVQCISNPSIRLPWCLSTFRIAWTQRAVLIASQSTR